MTAIAVEQLKKEERQRAGGGDRPGRAVIEKAKTESDDCHRGGEFRKVLQCDACDWMCVLLF